MLKAIKTALWQIIRAEGIEITNQNIDWLLERAWKSAQVTDAPSAETRENQIDEMAELIYKETDLYNVDTAYDICTVLHDNGYRKIHDDNAIQCVCYALGCQAAEKIKSEFAREIIDHIEVVLNKMFEEYAVLGQAECCMITEIIWRKLSAALKKKYTEGEG